MTNDKDETSPLALVAARTREARARGEINDQGVRVVDGVEMVEEIPFSQEEEELSNRALDREDHTH